MLIRQRTVREFAILDSKTILKNGFIRRDFNGNYPCITTFFYVKHIKNDGPARLKDELAVDLI